MFQTTQIPVVFWIINKNKKEEDKGKIFMINASEEFTKKGKFNDWQNNKSFFNYIHRIEEDGLSKYVSILDIEKKSWNLSLNRYVFKTQDDEDIDFIQLNNSLTKLNDKIKNKEEELFSIMNSLIKIIG